MILLGDISGIQTYLFNVTRHAAGQSRRLRARSFFLRLVPELAALRIWQAAGWDSDSLIFSAAGKFLLRGLPLSTQAYARVQAETATISRWLTERTGAEITLAVAASDFDTTLLPNDAYEQAMVHLQHQKLRPFSGVAIEPDSGKWNPAAFVLDDITPVCVLCRHHRAVGALSDEGVSAELVCPQCLQDYEMGKRLVAARWLSIYAYPATHCPFDLLGFGVQLDVAPPGPLLPTLLPSTIPSLVRCYFLGDKHPEPRLDLPVPSTGHPSPLRWARHIPEDQHTRRPLDFDEIAHLAKGFPLLGVLKMDADRLGEAVSRNLRDQSGTAAWQTLKTFSERLDRFFACRLDQELTRPQWSSIYTVFAGGDDLLLVGPWNVVFDYAAHAQRLFAQEFAREGLTISAGLALLHGKLPIRRAAEQAEEQLEIAKNSGRDSFAAFGQVWQWRHHDAIAESAHRFTWWVEQGTAERGWLHTLLKLATTPDPLAHSRLAYHIARNHPKSDDRNVDKAALGHWSTDLCADFETREYAQTRYLPTILRYALTATRSVER